MIPRLRTGFGVGILVGLLLAVSALLWWQTRGPSQNRIRKTVITTIEGESPASFLVTGTLQLNVRVRVDSSQYLTPAWLTYLLEGAQPGTSMLMRGGAATEVEVPGTVSYGFDVRKLTPSMVTLVEDRLVEVDLPRLSVQTVAPDLTKLSVKSETTGWMQILPSDAPDSLRTRALEAAEAALRSQARRRIRSATQPRVNTARALEEMLRPALIAAGISEPRFRIRVGTDLVLQPEG